MSQLTRAWSVTWSGQRTPSASKEIPPALMVFYAWTTVAICVAFCIQSSHWKRWYYKCKAQRLHPSIIKLTTFDIILWNKNSKNFTYTFCVFTSSRWPACVRNYLFFLPERITPSCKLWNCQFTSVCNKCLCGAEHKTIFLMYLLFNVYCSSLWVTGKALFTYLLRILA